MCEFEIHTSPVLSIATPIGASIPEFGAATACGVPSVASLMAVLPRLSVTHALPSASIAIPKGLWFSREGGHGAPFGSTDIEWMSKTQWSVGFPERYCVTVPPQQLAIQMFPHMSDTVACAPEMQPCVKPVFGHRGDPSGANFETLTGAGAFLHGHEVPKNPKLPIQMSPCGSRQIPNPAPLTPPFFPLKGEPVALAPLGSS